MPEFSSATTLQEQEWSLVPTQIKQVQNQMRLPTVKNKPKQKPALVSLSVDQLFKRLLQFSLGIFFLNFIQSNNLKLIFS